MDLTKLRPSGAALVSGVVLLLWSAHVLGLTPALTAGNDEVLKAAVYTVLGFWVGSANLPSAVRPVAAAAAVAAPLLPVAVSELESLVEGARRG